MHDIAAHHCSAVGQPLDSHVDVTPRLLRSERCAHSVNTSPPVAVRSEPLDAFGHTAGGRLEMTRIADTYALRQVVSATLAPSYCAPTNMWQMVREELEPSSSRKRRSAMATRAAPGAGSHPSLS